VKALDTPALVDLLEGGARIRKVLRRWRGEELATTEVNLLELAWLVGASPSKTRAGRMAAVTRLRRRISVLPIDTRVGEEAARRLLRGGPLPGTNALSMLCALEVSGCDELVTEDSRQLPGKWRFRVTELDKRAPK